MSKEEMQEKSSTAEAATDTAQREEKSRMDDDSDINKTVYGDFNYGELNPSQSVLLTFLISFVTGILTASFVLFIYLHYIKPPPLRYYRFNLSEIMGTVEKKIMKDGRNLSREDIKRTVDSYISAVGAYVDFYAKRGIVFVGGATIGNSPYITDITGGFYDYYRKIGKR